MIRKATIIVLFMFSYIAVFSISAEGGSASIENKAIVLLGISSHRYRIPEILKKLKVEKSTKHTITNNAPALHPKNNFRLDKLPRIFPKQPSKYIIMADFSLNKGIVPNIVLKSLIRDIKRGSTLVILGGLFTLNKGEFKTTLLAPLLPVETDAQWAVKKLRTPLKTPGGYVAYIHDLPMTSGSKTLFSVDGQPLWVEKKCGEGKILVFLGIPSSTSKSKMPLFWLDKRWPKFAADMIKK